jgi:hypothetical protein
MMLSVILLGDRVCVASLPVRRLPGAAPPPPPPASCGAGRTSVPVDARGRWNAGGAAVGWKNAASYERWALLDNIVSLVEELQVSGKSFVGLFSLLSMTMTRKSRPLIEEDACAAETTTQLDTSGFTHRLATRWSAIVRYDVVFVGSACTGERTKNTFKFIFHLIHLVQIWKIMDASETSLCEKQQLQKFS